VGGQPFGLGFSRVTVVGGGTAPSPCRHDKVCNRDESRTVTVFDAAGQIAGTDWHPLFATIIRVEQKVSPHISNTGLLHRSTEIAFSIFNKPVTAARAAEAIRANWGGETTSHYSRDVTTGEGGSCI
jgi:hypothetical protein